MSYRDLIKNLKTIVNEGLTERKQDLNLATTHTNWELGKRLTLSLSATNAHKAFAGRKLRLLLAMHPV